MKSHIIRHKAVKFPECAMRELNGSARINFRIVAAARRGIPTTRKIHITAIIVTCVGGGTNGSHTSHMHMAEIWTVSISYPRIMAATHCKLFCHSRRDLSVWPPRIICYRTIWGCVWPNLLQNSYAICTKSNAISPAKSIVLHAHRQSECHRVPAAESVCTSN